MHASGMASEMALLQRSCAVDHLQYHEDVCSATMWLSTFREQPVRWLLLRLSIFLGLLLKDSTCPMPGL
jgi:hypothetical protein